MKTIMVVLLLIMSPSLLADRPDCSFNPRDCRNGIPSGRIVSGDKIVAVPEPGTLALMGLGAAGLVVARRRKDKTSMPCSRRPSGRCFCMV